jgi:hypothetical protein
MKSPLYTEMSKQLSLIQKGVNTKLDAIEKSVADRLSNIQKALDKFYSQPLYKSADMMPVTPTMKEQMAEGKVKFSM